MEWNGMGMNYSKNPESSEARYGAISLDILIS